MLVISVLTLVSAAAVPQVLSGSDRARAVAAARHLAQRCAVARFHAVGRGRSVALRFTPAGGDHLVEMFADGNRNGVHAADIAAGVDTPVGSDLRLSSEYAGVRIALDPALGLGVDPIKLGGTTLLTFSPSGTATSGSVYVLGRDGTQLAVRVLGVTARTRVLRYQRSTGAWELP